MMNRFIVEISRGLQVLVVNESSAAANFLDGFLRCTASWLLIKVRAKGIHGI